MYNTNQGRRRWFPVVAAILVAVEGLGAHGKLDVTSGNMTSRDGQRWNPNHGKFGFRHHVDSNQWTRKMNLKKARKKKREKET